jgi:hypothetical protein
MSEEKRNSDAGQDERQIMEIMQRELMPVFQKLVADHSELCGRMDNLEKDHGETKSIAHGLYGGLKEAHKKFRRGKLSESINLDDLGDARDIYKAHEGSDMKDDLINHIVEHDIPDEHLEEMLNNLRENSKTRYGGFKRIEVEKKDGESPSIEVNTEKNEPEPGKGDLKDTGFDKGTGVLADKGPAKGSGVLSDKEEPKGKKSAADGMFETVMSMHKSRQKSLSKDKI